MSDFSVTPDDDRERVKIELGTSQGYATASQLDGIIAALLHAKASLIPEILTTMPEPPEMPPFVDPIYWTTLDKSTDNTLLAIRHQGAGWVPAIFPRIERERLTSYLVEQTAEARQLGLGPVDI